MPQGLEVYDESGNLTFSSNDRLARFKGEIAITSAVDGSTNVPGLWSSGANVFYYFLSNGESTWGTGCPSISISGDTISWTYGPAGASTFIRSTGTIFYGVY